MSFSVGDRVLVINSFENSLCKKLGVVVVINKNRRASSVGVQFDELHGGLHDLQGYCGTGFGWWFPEEGYLQLIGHNDGLDNWI